MEATTSMMNSQYFMIGVVVVVALVCYLMWKEVKKTQVDVTGLKTFSTKVANYIESSATRPAVIAVSPTVPDEDDEDEVVDESEAKKED